MNHGHQAESHKITVRLAAAFLLSFALYLTGLLLLAVSGSGIFVETICAVFVLVPLSNWLVKLITGVDVLLTLYR
jgi:hypothetical protein